MPISTYNLFHFVGWGKVEEKGANSRVLLYVDIPVWNREECADVLADTGAPVLDTNICAADYEGGKDACQVSTV